MRRALTYLFLTAMVLYTFSQVVIVTGYFINRDYIAQNLCENKDKPEMECNGQCHLRKELKKDEERKTDESGISTTQEIYLYCKTQEIRIVEVPPIPVQKQAPLNAYQRAMCSGVRNGIFHPPTPIV